MRPLHLARMGCAELCAITECRADSRRHRRVTMAQQQRAMAAEEVDIAVAIDVPFVRAGRTLDEDAVGVHIAGIVGDAAGEQFARLVCQRSRTRGPLAIGGDDTGVASKVAGDVIHDRPHSWLRLPYCRAVARLARGRVQMFDLVLKGGRIVDPGRGVDARLDVAFAHGKVAEIGPDLVGGTQTRDVSGLIVVPGLIDLHTHVYWGGTSLGVDPDAYAKSSGLTTLIATVLTLEQGEFVFEDVLGEKLKAEQRLACRGIVLGGRWWHE